MRAYSSSCSACFAPACSAIPARKAIAGAVADARKQNLPMAIGVSGGSAEQDGVVAKAGLDALLAK